MLGNPQGLSPQTRVWRVNQHALLLIEALELLMAILPYHIVQYIGIMKVRGFWPKIISPKPAWYLLPKGLGVLVRQSQAQNVFGLIPVNSYEIRFFYWLTYLLMPLPSDKHNLRTGRARDFISSLINVTSSSDLPFHQLQQLQCLHHGCTPLISHSFFTTA